MKKAFFLMAASLLLAAACTDNTPKEPVDYVDPFIGTAFHGHTYPGATTPFGAVQLSPDNYRGVWDACSGYHYDQDEIIGFSHTHLSGTGCADLADILFVPTSHDVDLDAEGDIYKHLPFKHKDEIATPGYYSVFFRKEGVKAELSATTHTGWHRYTWTKGKPHDIVIDMSHSITTNEVIHAVEIFQTASNEIRGMRKTSAWTPNQYVYFVAQFSRDIESIRYIDGRKEVDSPEACTTSDRQVILSFGETGGPVVAKVGLSQTCYEGAEDNLIRECGDHLFDFDRIRKEARYDWNKQLSAISVEGGTEAQKRIFYTSLYHTAIVPNITSDGCKVFRRQNEQLSKVAFGKNFYSTLSLWDTFRAWLPLSTIIYPQVAHDIVYSCLDMYEAQGQLPIWPLCSGETFCMIGYHSIPFIVDAFTKGLLPDLNPEYALNAMIVSSNINEKGSDYYTKYGFIPADKKSESVSVLLEFAYDDWCIGCFAQIIGKKDIADEYFKRAKNYINVFDGSTGFFRGKQSDGTFVTPFNLFEPSREYTEATAWQYRFFVPHDFAGLSNLLGGRDKLAEAVDECFAANPELDGFRSDITGMIGQYAHGNEPSHHMAYIYNYAGQPWKTQEWTRRICREMYTDKPDGLCGNEDCGQMSAWFVMTALGIYEVCPGSGQFTFTTPTFDKVYLMLPSAKGLTITANDPANNPYIQKVTFNGIELEKAYINWIDLREGGELAFELGPEPNKELWTGEEAAPFSLSKEKFVSKPYYKTDGMPQIFEGSIEVELGSMTEGAEVHYTLDGNAPTINSPVYRNTLMLSDDTEIRAIACKEGLKDSDELSVKFHKARYIPANHGKHTENGVNYTLYHGDFQWAAEVEKFGEKVGSGTLPHPSLEAADQEDYFGLVYTGWIYIPETRIWQFSLICDDGGVFYIGDNLIVDNDGTHSVSHVKGLAALEEGYYPFTVKYLESYEDQALMLGWWPEGAKEPVAIPDANYFVK